MNAAGRYDKYCSQTPTPTPPLVPSLLARSQPQPQCEFGINPETGLCNTEDIPSEPLAPTPEPATTPDEEFGTEQEPEEIVEEEPEEMERKLENNVLEVTKLNADGLIQQSGIEPTFTNEEVLELIAEVKKELHI